MIFGNSPSISWRPLVFGIQPVGEQSSAAAEQEFIIHFHKLFLPESILVQDVAGQDTRRDTSCQVLESLPKACQ